MLLITRTKRASNEEFRLQIKAYFDTITYCEQLQIQNPEKLTTLNVHNTIRSFIGCSW